MPSVSGNIGLLSIISAIIKLYSIISSSNSLYGYSRWLPGLLSRTDPRRRAGSPGHRRCHSWWPLYWNDLGHRWRWWWVISSHDTFLFLRRIFISNCFGKGWNWNRKRVDLWTITPILLFPPLNTLISPWLEDDQRTIASKRTVDGWLLSLKCHQDSPRVQSWQPNRSYSFFCHSKSSCSWIF